MSSLVLGKASGRLLATGGDDCRVNLWSINKPNCIMVSDELRPLLGSPERPRIPLVLLRYPLQKAQESPRQPGGWPTLRKRGNTGVGQNSRVLVGRLAQAPLSACQLVGCIFTKDRVRGDSDGDHS